MPRIRLPCRLLTALPQHPTSRPFVTVGPFNQCVSPTKRIPTPFSSLSLWFAKGPDALASSPLTGLDNSCSLRKAVSLKSRSPMASQPVSSSAAATVSSTSRRPVRAIVFDMDGTLTNPTMDWQVVRHKLGISEGSDILLYMQSLSSSSPKFSDALKVVREEEERAVRELELRDGCLAMLRDLWSKNIKLGLLTRNCDDGVKAVLKLMGISQSLSSNDLFSQIVTRSFRPAKPSPDPLLHMCKQWSLDPDQVIMVGDTRDDLECGRAAGATTIIIRTPYNSSILDMPNFVISRLDEISGALADRLP